MCARLTHPNRASTCSEVDQYITLDETNSRVSDVLDTQYKSCTSGGPIFTLGIHINAVWGFGAMTIRRLLLISRETLGGGEESERRVPKACIGMHEVLETHGHSFIAKLSLWSVECC
jgi:hypothetical protein